MRIDLTGKVALVTGASSGIGYATAVTLAECGAAVCLNYHRNESGAAQAQKQISDAGGRAISVQADVTRTDEVTKLVQRASAELGPLDILVNNAGSLVERLRILDLTESRWDEVIDLNLKSAFLCSQAVIPSMIERKQGNIINVSSIAGRTGGGLGAIHYASAKGGLISFTKGLAKELAPLGIRVNAVTPGVIDTAYHEQFSTAEMIKSAVNATPLGRVGTAQEVANVITFMASEEASYLIGETIEINGGLYMD